MSEEIRQNDEAHSAIMRRHFSLQWGEPENYDVVLNTQRVSISECILIFVKAHTGTGLGESGLT